MANDHARIRRDIWADIDWRRLTSSAQWLYVHLLTNRTLTFAGIADWRPNRIAALTADLGAADVNMFAGELIRERFILPDLETEEVLIRSWVKHDGLLRSPNMTKALIKAHEATASNVLRAVIVDQLTRLMEAETEGCWDLLDPLLATDSMTFEEGVEILSGNPSENPSGNPSGKGSAKGFENRAPLHTPYSFLHSPSSSSSLPVPHQDDEDSEQMMSATRHRSAS